MHPPPPLTLCSSSTKKKQNKKQKKTLAHLVSQLIWSVLTFLLAKAHTPAHFYALRFLIGLFESSSHPGILYLLGSWYRHDELGKRTAVLVNQKKPAQAMRVAER